MKTKIIAAVVVLLSVIGCTDEEIKTVDWWVENEQERIKKVEECLSTDDEIVRKSPNCVNAIEARDKINLIGVEDDDDWLRAPRVD